MLRADDDTLGIGNFNVELWHGRYVINSFDNRCGISPYPGEDKYFYIWAGWRSDDDCDFFVRGDGLVRISNNIEVGNNVTVQNDIKLRGKEHGWKKTWSLCGMFDYLYDAVDDLQNQIDNIDIGS